jgi:drug/metabolite transporter (DMT)-like permease
LVDSSRRIKVILAMAIMYVVWGTTYLAIKVGLDAGLPPTLFAGVRQIPAAALLFGIATWRGASLRMSPRDLRISAIVGILLIVGGQYFTFLAEQTVPSGISALVVALLPLWIALAESAFPDMQRPGRLGWVGLAIGFSGLGILLAPRLVGVSAGAGEWLDLQQAAPRRS